MPKHELFAATPLHPTADPGQLVDPGRDRDRHLAIRAVRLVPRGLTTFPCLACDATFASPEEQAAHEGNRHPRPIQPPPAASAAPRTSRVAVKAATPAAPPAPPPAPPDEAPQDPAPPPALPAP